MSENLNFNEILRNGEAIRFAIECQKPFKEQVLKAVRQLICTWAKSQIPNGSLFSEEDLATETTMLLEKALTEKRIEFRSPESFVTYVKAIARNRLVDSIRRDPRQKPSGKGRVVDIHYSTATNLIQSIAEKKSKY